MKYVATCALALVLTLPWFGVSAGTTMIENFESALGPFPWIFDNGSEFAGATGDLTASAGFQGDGARLSYDLRNGGAYVKATLTLGQPVTANAIGLWLRSPAGIRIRLRVVDSTHQTLQYKLARPLTATDAGAWYRQVVDLAAPSQHWGGANDGVVHGALQSITIMAGDALEKQNAVGAIYFDKVVAIDDLKQTIDPFTGLVPPPANAINFAADFGVSTHVTDDARTFDIVKALGFEWVRMGLIWSNVERSPGRYDWSKYDDIVAKLEARGLRALFHLSYENQVHGGLPVTQDAVEAFADFARAAAEHFKGHGVRYEIWNEPNLARFWNPPDAGRYARLAKAASAAIHAGDPSAKVATGGLSEFDYPYLRKMLNAGAAQGADAIGIHPYRRVPESVTDELMLMRSIVDKAARTGLPIWDTEWGYSSTWFGGNGHAPTARMRQAVLVVRELAMARALGLRYPIYYELRDFGTNPGNPEHNFGLVASDYSYKPAAFAVRTLIETTSGRAFAGMLQLKPSSLHGLRFDGETDSVLMLWSSAPGSRIPVTVPGSLILATDLLGAPIPLSPAANGKLQITISERAGPVYLVFSNPGGTGDTEPNAGSGGDPDPDLGEGPGSGPEPVPVRELDASSELNRILLDRSLQGGW